MTPRLGLAAVLAALVEELDHKGADDITVTAPAYVFRRANRLLERLDARI